MNASPESKRGSTNVKPAKACRHTVANVKLRHNPECDHCKLLPDHSNINNVTLHPKICFILFLGAMAGRDVKRSFGLGHVSCCDSGNDEILLWGPGDGMATTCRVLVVPHEPLCVQSAYLNEFQRVQFKTSDWLNLPACVCTAALRRLGRRACTQIISASKQTWRVTKQIVLLRGGTTARMARGTFEFYCLRVVYHVTWWAL
jgi:hypothetical protein